MFKFKTFLRDASGATAIEEALVVAFLALAALGVITLGGAKLYAVFADMTEALSRDGSASSQR